jgi:hypothetical protein
MTEPHAAPEVGYAARLVPLPREGAAPDPSSWFITHPLGGPAGGTYTEVVIEAGPEPAPEHVVDEVVRRIARDLYGDRWAAHYAPTEYAHVVKRYGMRRRERVLVQGIEVYS